MKIQNKHYHTIWIDENQRDLIHVIDQRSLPFRFELFDLRTAEDAYYAIAEMVVRGAPLIGVTAAYGMYLATCNFNGSDFEGYMNQKADYLKSSRPTAVNLAYAVDIMLEFILQNGHKEGLKERALQKALELKNQEIEFGNSIGEQGLTLIEEKYKQTGKPVNILTHCNAGWLACIDWGTATAPIYKAHLKGIPVHVWVDETRPRNQGARLTAYELQEQGVPHTVIPDNSGGHLMQHGLVDMVIVGSDRTTISGDVANKIGTYLKALAAFDNGIPFYVALPSSTFDWNLSDGIREIPIEQRDPKEVSHIEGWNGERIETLALFNRESPVANYGFDVTPARLVTSLITERGICRASKEEITKLFPEALESK